MTDYTDDQLAAWLEDPNTQRLTPEFVEQMRMWWNLQALGWDELVHSMQTEIVDRDAGEGHYMCLLLTWATFLEFTGALRERLMEELPEHLRLAFDATIKRLTAQAEADFDKKYNSFWN